MTTEDRVVSRDGTPLAFERLGHGAPVIVVAGALQGRSTYRPFAAALSRHVEVLNFDRRGRGDSGDTPPYAVEREVEDLDALIAVAGGTASLYGHSSGAALVLHAAARGLPIDKIVLHEAPFGSGSEEERQAEQEEADQLAALLDQGRRADAVALFYASMGLPPEVAAEIAEDPAQVANAPTLLSDPFEITSARSRGGLTPAEQAAGVAVPGLVLAGGASPDWMLEASRQLAEALPEGRLRVLEGHGHVVPPEVLAPLVADFVTS